ncbi:MAG: ammonia channel protein [SAR324 cluster bacterium]|uniref:Ammonium transporter n=1 Tax=SAR324 cluster bacterium TaxID=2024889 RepID=A0A2A4T1Q3_9DELT|nr:MAG: ammonia channel protein [SAR324 cluster bacterium]
MYNTLKHKRIYLFFFLFLIPNFAIAAEKIDKADTAWMMISTGLVLLMIPGLAMFYGGMSRSNHVLSVIMHSLFAMGVMTIQWYVIGYTLSWGSDVGGFVGSLEFAFLNNVGMEAKGSIPHVLFMMFQGMFAIITPAIIAGAVVERIKFSAWVVFMVVWGTLVYDPLVHMVWHPDGFLLQRGGLDFAGGTVVHISSGVSALVLSLILGTRLRYGKIPMPPHNLVMTVLGAGLLWFGWFGFNAGSALEASALAANALVVTHLSAGAGLFSWVMAEWILLKKPSILGAASGLVAGLVAITPGAGFISPGASVLIGLMGGIVCFLGVRVKTKFGFDDSLDAFGVHGLGGIFGALITGFFASTAINPAGADGIFYNLSSGLHLFYEQAFAVVFTIIYASVLTWIIAKVIDKTIGLRVTEDEELQGLDANLHGERAYND